MKHFSYVVENMSVLRAFVDRDGIVTHYREASSVLVQVYSASKDDHWYLDISACLADLMPNAVIIGASTVGEISKGQTLTGQTVVSFSFFQTSYIKPIMSVCAQNGEEQAALEFLDQIPKSDQDIKGLLFLATPLSMDMKRFFDRLDAAKFDFPLFGGGAGDYALMDRSMVFCGTDALESGAVAVIFYGEDLEIDVQHYLGWRSLSKQMTITKVTGQVVETIDHRPAFDVYQRYLDIQDDENFFLNVLEFPFLINRQGLDVARVPVTVTPDKGLQFVADIHEGEQCHIAYGDPSLILSNAKEIHQATHDFSPEAIFLYTCGCRRFLMQEDTNMETMPFQNSAQTVGFYTYGEFLSHKGELQTLNSAMLSISMREGGKKASKQVKTAKVNVLENEMDPYAHQHSRIVSRLVHFVDRVTSELEEANRDIEKLSLTDQLTGIPNRRKLDEALLESQALAERYGVNLSVMMLDIDYFKDVNDQFGHLVGDRVLQEFARVIKTHIRDVDILGRWGGEEFMLLLPNTTLEQAATLAEKLRHEIATYTFDGVGQKTSSFGVTAYKKGDDSESLINRVDRGLYDAKNAGRNCVKTLV
ncbi:MAG: GGDEF domain-containing protein [Methylocystaceae bacterium]|nr:GGDEF domain-containing protein [Methylocystaceae bacterium]